MVVEKKLTLISPLASKASWEVISTFVFRIWAFLKVASLTPPDWDVSIVDEKVEALDLKLDVDLVGITAMTPAANRAYEIADSFRSRGNKSNNGWYACVKAARRGAAALR